MVFRLKIFRSLWSLGKCLSIRARNLSLMLVLVFLLNGGLYQMMLLRCLFFRLFVVGGSYCRVKWYLFSSSAFWYGGTAWSKDALSEDRDERCLLMPAGMFFVVMGGSLLSRWTYCNSVFGLVKG